MMQCLTLHPLAWRTDLSRTTPVGLPEVLREATEALPHQRNANVRVQQLHLRPTNPDRQLSVKVIGTTGQASLSRHGSLNGDVAVHSGSRLPRDDDRLLAWSFCLDIRPADRPLSGDTALHVICDPTA